MKFIIETEDVYEAQALLNTLTGNSQAQPAADARGVTAAVAAAPETDKPAARRTRKPKDAPAETTAAAPAPVAETVAATTTAAPVSDWDEDEPATPAEVVYTKDDVRAALVSYQNRLTTATAGPELEAARVKVLGLLAGVGKAEKLGLLLPENFKAVIDAANAAK